MSGMVRVAPDEPNPTHHVALRDRSGQRLGLILCDGNGKVAPNFAKNPVQRTALKTTSGNSSYSDLEYPYSPIVQDDWSGGRGNLDFERDSTRYYDSFRVRTGRANKVFLGPQEQYTTGNRAKNEAVPGNVTFRKMLGTWKYLERKFTAGVNYTAANGWLLLRKRGAPADLTLSLYSDSGGNVGSFLYGVFITAAQLEDCLSEWVQATLGQALTSGTAYHVMIYPGAGDDGENCWEVGTNPAPGSSSTYGSENGISGWTKMTFDFYYRITDAEIENNAVFYEYKEQQYAIINPASGAPKVYMNGDRGAADANTGQLTKLIDATKSWTTNQWAGCVVMLIDGTGKTEPIPWRTITGNTGTELTVSPAWTITQDTTTEYVILGASSWQEMTGHGLTAPVSSVLVSTAGVVYYAMGGAVLIRRHREYNNAGTWTATDWADESAGSYADFLTFKPQAKKIYRGQNGDATGEVSISSADVPAWGTALSWSTVIVVGSKYRKMTRLECYPDDSGDEAIYVFKQDLPWVVSGTSNPKPLAIREMESVRSPKNGKSTLVHNVYLYFSLQNGLERYYGGNLDEVGPNTGEGMPADRKGPLVALIGYPGKFFAAVDAEGSGYSSVLDRDGNGFHERYRAPKGQRILALGFQPIPGTLPDRLWVYQGNELIWLPFPSEGTNELEDSNYRYTHEGALVLSRMHAGMMDVQKLVKTIKVWSTELEAGICWVELDYRLDENEAWTSVSDKLESSPQAVVDFSNEFGIAGKRLQLRLRFQTTNASKTPVVLALIVDAVLRTGIKYMFPLTFRLADDDENLSGDERDGMSAAEKLTVMENWADASSSSMLMMEAVSALWHGKMVFLNPPDVRQLVLGRPGTAEGRNVYVCSASLQEA